MHNKSWLNDWLICWLIEWLKLAEVHVHTGWIVDKRFSALSPSSHAGALADASSTAAAAADTGGTMGMVTVGTGSETFDLGGSGFVTGTQSPWWRCWAPFETGYMSRMTALFAIICWAVSAGSGFESFQTNIKIQKLDPIFNTRHFHKTIMAVS